MSLVVATKASAQTASLTLSSGSGSPGGSVSLNLTFHSNGSQATGIQWAFVYSSTDFSSVSVAATSLSTGAGEVLSCNSLAGRTTCLMIDLGSNSVVVPDGVIATATFHIASGTTHTSSQITFDGLSATNSGGTALALTGTGATVTINQPVGPALSNLSCSPAGFTPPGTSTCTVSLSGAATSNVSVGLSSNRGSVTVPSSVSIATGNSSAAFTASAPTAVTSNTSVTLTATLSSVSRNFSIGLTAAQVQQPGVSLLACTPNTLAGGTNSYCTVTLAGTAPAGGTTVSVWSNNSGATAPAAVTVPAGQTSAGFTVTTLAVSSTQTATLSATSAGITKTAALTIQPAGLVAGLTCSPGTIGPSGSTTCTVGLTTGAPIGGVVVALSSNSSSVSIPASVVVPSGSMSAVFTAVASAGSPNLTAILTAALNGVKATFSLTVSTSPNNQPSLVAVSCNPVAVQAGGVSQCSVTLSAPAPLGGIQAALSSTNSNVAVPAWVTIQAGATTAGFTATVSAGALNGTSTIQASAGSASVSTVLTVSQSQNPARLICTPATVQTPGSATCTLTLGGPAQSKLLVTLSSSSTAVTVPPSVTINSGLTTATFTANVAAVTSNSTVTLTASVDGASQSLSLLAQVNTNVSVNSVSCTPQTLTGGGTSGCQITLSRAAPSGGVSVQLSSSSTQVTVPATVPVAGGGSTAPFSATSALIDHDDSATLTASLSKSSAQTALTLVGLKLVAMACSPKSLPSGSPVSCQITLNSDQAASTVTLAVSSTSSKVTAPATVSSQAGQASISFQASTKVVTGNQSVTLSASYNGITVQDTVTLTPAPPVLTVPGPQSARPGKTTSFKISATDPSGLTVALTVSGLPPGAMFAPINGTFAWVPDVSQIGLHTVQFTATNLALASTTADVQIDVGSDTPVIIAFTNAASWANDGGCSPGSVATLLGAGFVNAPGKAAEISPVPTEVNSVRVKANDVYLPLFYASPNQVNLQCPQFQPGQALTLVLESNTGTSPPLSTKMLYATPGIFTLNASGEGQGAVLIAGTGDLAMEPVNGIPGQPAKPGGYISIYANGLGAVDTKLTPGQPAPLDRLVKVKSRVDVFVGGSSAEVTFAGLAPGFTGLYQVNARIPGSAQPGDAVSLQIAVHLPDGSVVKSNLVTIAVAAN